MLRICFQQNNLSLKIYILKSEKIDQARTAAFVELVSFLGYERVLPLIFFYFFYCQAAESMEEQHYAYGFIQTKRSRQPRGHKE